MTHAEATSILARWRDLQWNATELGATAFVAIAQMTVPAIEELVRHLQAQEERARKAALANRQRGRDRSKKRRKP